MILLIICKIFTKFTFGMSGRKKIKSSKRLSIYHVINIG